jgi:ATP-dependent transcriptional regulator
MSRYNPAMLYTHQPVQQALTKLWDFSLTVIEAPMGYGKTTAVREFLKNCGAAALWQTVYDSSAIAFWNGFSRLIATIAPAAGHGLAEIGVPVDNVLREEAVELIGSLKLPEPTVLVIDDYHVLSADNIDHFFERLVQSVVPNLHIVIVSRSVFGEKTAEFALKGYCQVLDIRYFALTAGEIAEYCKACGIGLNPEEAAFLYSYTEGWISAVYLCILGYQQAGRVERQSASLYELLDKVVYQPCPAEMREFLTVISIFDSFSLSLAEHMWPKGNAAALLARLTAENAFIRFDYASGTYTMHNILNGYLRRIFAGESLERRRTLWQRAGEWYLAAGDYRHAMDYFYQAGEFEPLMAAIETAKGTVFGRQPKEERIKYFRECPPTIKSRHPLAGIIYAFNLFLSHEPALFAAQCRELAADIALLPDAAFRAGMTGELEVLRGITAYNDLVEMARHFEAAWELLQGPSAFVDTKMPWTLGSPSVLYQYYRESGALAAAVKTITRLPCYYRLSCGHGSGGEYVMEAEWHYYKGDFDRAAIVAHKAQYVAQANRQPALVLCAVFLSIRLALARGDWDYVAKNLRQAREAVKQQTLYMYMHTLDLCDGFIFACLNQANRIPAWIAQGDLPETLLFVCYGFYNIIRDKALLIGGQYHQLAGIAGEHAAIAAAVPNPLAQVYTGILAAAALDRLGRRDEALAALEKALAIAAPDEVVMPFVENGDWIAGLLAALEAGQHAAFIGRIQKMYPPIAARWREIAARLSAEDGKPAFTKREAAIADLVAAGLSNQAIGKRLNIAEDTVKKTLKKIFVKLGVSNRATLTRIVTEQKML